MVMSGDPVAGAPADSRINQRLAAVREALRRDTAPADTVDALTALVDALDSYRSESASRSPTR
jgi:hypothetical protein